MAPARSARKRFATGISGAGLLMALINTSIGALQPVVTRWSALKIHPLLYCAGATAVGALCVATAINFTGEIGALVHRRYWPTLFGISLLGTVVTSLMLIYGLQKVNAVSAVLLLQTEPIYSLILATALLGERPSLRQLIATGTIICGIAYVLSGANGIRLTASAWLLLATPFFWQASHVLSLRVMPPLSPLVITGARYVYAAFVLTAIFLLAGAPGIVQLADLRTASMIALTGVLIYFFGSLSWYGAISRLSLTWTTALVVPGVPLLSVLFAMGFLGEKVSARQATGIAIATAGVLGLVFGAESQRGMPAAAEAAAGID